MTTDKNGNLKIKTFAIFVSTLSFVFAGMMGLYTKYIDFRLDQQSEQIHDAQAKLDELTVLTARMESQLDRVLMETLSLK